MSGALDRTLALLCEETEGLRSGEPFDVHATALRKHRLLLDLHHLRAAPVPAERLRELREALERNRTELDARLAVARRIAAIAIDVVREDGRDGTYGAGSDR